MVGFLQTRLRAFPKEFWDSLGNAALRCVEPRCEADTFRDGKEKKRDLKRARASYLRALRYDPQSMDIRYKLAICASLEGRHRWAIRCAEGMLRIDPDNTDALEMLGSQWDGLGDQDKGLAYYRRAFETDAFCPYANFGVGTILLNKDEYQEAITYLRRACRIKTDYRAAWHNLGRAHHCLKQYREAAEAYEKAVLHDPTDIMGFVMLVHARLEMWNLDTAEAALHEGYVAWGSVFGDHDLLHGEEPTADPFREASPEPLSPGEPLLLELLQAEGRIHFKHEHWDDGVTVFKKALLLDPADYYSLGGYADCLLGAARYEEALEAFRRAMPAADEEGKAEIRESMDECLRRIN